MNYKHYPCCSLVLEPDCNTDNVPNSMTMSKLTFYNVYLQEISDIFLLNLFLDLYYSVFVAARHVEVIDHVPLLLLIGLVKFELVTWLLGDMVAM